MDGKLQTLSDMGFSNVEAEMALKDNSYNVDAAIEKLLSGQYKPPPYESNLYPNQELTCVNPGITNPTSDHHHHHSSILHSLTTPFKKKTTPLYHKDKASAPSLFHIEGENGQQFTTLPPPYEKIKKKETLRSWEATQNITYLSEQELENTSTIARIYEDRCSTCFNELVNAPSQPYGDPYGNKQNTSMNKNIVKESGKYYHTDCYKRKYGPKCSYCCLLLSEPDKDNELSGQYLLYKDKNYHIECYEKYAGPRCTYCFNVIIERPNGEYSGNWVVDKMKEYHVECFEKKMNALWKAKQA